MLKDLSKSMCIALVISILVSMAFFDAKCTVIKSNVLRLHIMANSDSVEDQQVKEAVRDRIIMTSGELFESVENYKQAVEMVEGKLPQIESTVKDELKNQGVDMPVKVYVGTAYFDTRRYDKAVLPAGEYTALKVEIGEGAGHNWWCVMFPSLCLPAVSEKQEVEKVLDSKSADIVTNSQDYEIGFKVVEWYEKIKNYIKRKGR